MKGRRVRLHGAARPIVWLVVSLLHGAESAHAAALSFTLPRGTIELAKESFVIDGRATDIRLFDAPGPLARIADTVARQGGPGAVLAGLPDGVLISGIDADALWSVRLRVAGNRVAGRIARGELRRFTPAGSPPTWLPAEGSMHLDVLSRDGASRQRIYAYPDRPSQLRGALRRRLAIDKWRELPGAAGFAEWRRGRERLEWLVVPLRTGSGLIVHTQEEPSQ